MHDLIVGIIGFFAITSIIYTIALFYDSYLVWKQKQATYQKCPTCGTYVLNLKRESN